MKRLNFWIDMALALIGILLIGGSLGWLSAASQNRCFSLMWWGR